MARIKWINHDVDFKRGVHKGVVVKFNNSEHWFTEAACCTTQTAKAGAKALADYVGATQVEIMYREDYHNEEPIIDYIFWAYETDGVTPCYKFRIEHEVPEGAKRKFTYFEKSELFKA